MTELTNEAGRGESPQTAYGHFPIHLEEGGRRPVEAGVEEGLKLKCRQIKLLLTDCDGVLTDGGVYYGENGEAFKRFNIKDGMAVERLRKFAGVDVGIITGELSPSVAKRAEKLKIVELHLGIKDKPKVLAEIMAKHSLQANEIAYIGDDTNDVEVLKIVGLAASPADGISFAKNVAHYICKQNGGQGCFRELAELIIEHKQQ